MKSLEQIADLSQGIFDRVQDVKKLVAILEGCPNGATRDALALHFPVETIDYAAALCLVKVIHRVVSGFDVTYYEALR